MLMLFALAAIIARPVKLVLPDAGAVAKSSPGFWRDLQNLWPGIEYREL